MHHIGPHSGPLCTITARIAHYDIILSPEFGVEIKCTHENGPHIICMVLHNIII